ncbi:MAG: NAD(P)/FAD-dependent oxidoreductase [Parvibaculales bacterium]
MKIAIIGSGISGNVAAYHLCRQHDITLYEKRDRLGGHSATKQIDYYGDGETMRVDTGFIVYNELNYPGLTSLFEALDVATVESNMSFGFSSHEGGFEWSGQSLDTVFAQRRNFASPVFWQMISGIFKFNRLAAQAHESGSASGMSLGDWLAGHGFGQSFINRYLLPMGAAIWSSPADEIMAFPADSFLQFFYNHRLINADRPQWRTVANGSQSYVEKLTANFQDRIRLASPVTRIERVSDGVAVTANGATEIYDQAVLACHSDQALAMLHDAAPEERDVLSAIRYLPNQVYLHKDAALMPKRRKVWSAWNYISHAGAGRDEIMTVSYWMNRLQNLDEKKPLFVTLNPPVPPRPELTFGHYEYDHPQFDAAALAAQKKLPEIQGKNRLWFCGAWAGFGFHEDGLQSALRVCESLQAQDGLPQAAE